MSEGHPPDLAAPSVWIAVIPFKGPPNGKSRMAGPFDPTLRAELADAFLLDTLSGLLSSVSVSSVYLVSDKAPSLPDAVRTIPDPGRGLNAAIASGVEAAREDDPNCRILVLAADLPLLSGAELQSALRSATSHPRAVVADKDGTGTTMLMAGPRQQLATRFGKGSFTAHLAVGYQSLDLATSSTLRFDIDTPSDLARAAHRDELGSATRALLRRIEETGRL